MPSIGTNAYDDFWNRPEIIEKQKEFNAIIEKYKMSKLYGCASCELKFTITIEDEPGVMTPMVKPAIIHCPVCGEYYPFSKIEEEE